ncbi:hypothetical protein PV396_13480 [Streptomyces sp. ME02-8801-2C]|uniref:hypothetical protein n=1 Tax=Streptomyces sp. ME02-8801-2C TaxID=3028680 RepID=UPI0029B14E2E|nr:hypothetical protein [Streptomyces sp. ME02-8801-2C]MDX3452949.1 hypothetical protein [Streptomyces sp. ME02-8801-2C]
MTHNNLVEPAGSAAPHAELVDCPDCQELDRAEAAARAEGDASKATDCRVLRARHRVGSRHTHTEGNQNVDAH